MKKVPTNHISLDSSCTEKDLALFKKLQIDPEPTDSKFWFKEFVIETEPAEIAVQVAFLCQFCLMSFRKILMIQILILKKKAVVMRNTKQKPC